MPIESAQRDALLATELDAAGAATEDLELHPEPVRDDEDGPQVAVNAEPAETEREAAAREGEEAAIFEQLKDAEDVTVSDLRRVAGADAEGLTDEQLSEMWAKAQEQAAGAKNAPAESPFPLYNEKGEKLDLKNLTVADLLSGKAHIAYQALGKEQRKALKDLVRTAANGHYNEQVTGGLRADVQQMTQRFQEANTKVAQYETDRGLWTGALEAAARGDVSKINAMIKAYADELMKGPAAAASQPAPEVQSAQLETAGLRVWHEQIVPEINRVAEAYGLPATGRDEAVKIVQWHLNQQSAFLTPERVKRILDLDLPAAIEAAGYERKSGVTAFQQPPADSAELAKLRAENLELKAGKANDKMQQLRDKRRAAPPAGRGAADAIGEKMPSAALKDRDSMKKWLRNEEQ